MNLVELFGTNQKSALRVWNLVQLALSVGIANSGKGLWVSTGCIDARFNREKISNSTLMVQSRAG